MDVPRIPQQEKAEVRARVRRGDDACRGAEAEPADLRAGNGDSVGIRRDTHTLGKVAYMLYAGNGVCARPQGRAAAHLRGAHRKGLRRRHTDDRVDGDGLQRGACGPRLVQGGQHRKILHPQRKRRGGDGGACKAGDLRALRGICRRPRRGAAFLLCKAAHPVERADL